LELGLVEGVLALELGAIVRKNVGAQTIESDGLEEAGGNNPIRIDFVANEGDASTGHLGDFTHDFLRNYWGIN
jgi:hypothetical protein